MLTRIVAKTIVIAEDGRILLLVRSDDDNHRPGGFDLPGGTVEHGETPTAGAAREAMEEAGLALDPSQLQLAYASTYAGHNEDLGVIVNRVWLGFVTKLPAGSKISLGSDHSRFTWMPLQQAVAETDAPTHRAFFEHMLNHNVLSGLWSDAA